MQWEAKIVETLNPFLIKSNQYVISPYNTTPESRIKITSKKKMIIMICNINDFKNFILGNYQLPIAKRENLFFGYMP